MYEAKCQLIKKINIIIKKKDMIKKYKNIESNSNNKNKNKGEVDIYKLSNEKLG